MAKKDVFICDNCEIVSQIVLENSELPYANGWRQIEYFEFKATNDKTHSFMKKQFCSSHCMLHFIERFVKIQEEEIHRSTMLTQRAR